MRIKKLKKTTGKKDLRLRKSGWGYKYVSRGKCGIYSMLHIVHKDFLLYKKICVLKSMVNANVTKKNIGSMNLNI